MNLQTSLLFSDMTSIFFSLISGITFFLGYNSVPWFILSLQSTLFFILSDLTNNGRNKNIKRSASYNLVKLLDHSNGGLPDNRIEDLHIPSGVLFRNPFIENDFLPQNVESIFSLTHKATIGNPFSTKQEEHYPIAKMVHFENMGMKLKFN